MVLTNCLILYFVALSSAHFVLNYPPSLGFDDDSEGESPCGGFSAVFNSNDASVPVGGFPVEMMSTHPQADWLFRATLNQTEPYTWTNLLPVVSQSGIGDFCLPALVAPADWAGQAGLLQISQDAADGALYQCAAVQFVTGTNTTVSSSCKNATGLVASITNEQSFGATTSATTGTLTTPTGGAAPSSSSPSAGETMAAQLGVGGVAMGLAVVMGLL